jgi:hypothetical protein
MVTVNDVGTRKFSYAKPVLSVNRNVSVSSTSFPAPPLAAPGSRAFPAPPNAAPVSRAFPAPPSVTPISRAFPAPPM